MPLTNVQRITAGSTGAQASLTATFTSTPTSGNLLVACGVSDATLTMTSTGWTLAISAINSCGLYQWWKVAGASESTTVQITPSVSDTVAMMIEEWSGNTASPVDKTASLAVQTATSHPVTGTTAALTQADELAVGVIGINLAATFSAWTNSYVEAADLTGGTGQPNPAALGVAELATSGTGTQTTSPTTSISTSQVSGLIATYKAAAAVADNTTKPALPGMFTPQLNPQGWF